jgi:hypothetical protein
MNHAHMQHVSLLALRNHCLCFVFKMLGPTLSVARERQPYAVVGCVITLCEACCSSAMLVHPECNYGNAGLEGCRRTQVQALRVA